MIGFDIALTNVAATLNVKIMSQQSCNIAEKTLYNVEKPLYQRYFNVVHQCRIKVVYKVKNATSDFVSFSTLYQHRFNAQTALI